MADDLTERRTESGDSVPHEGRMVYDVTTRKWYEVRDSYRLGHTNEVQLQPPGGYDTRHLPAKSFAAETGSRLLLPEVTQSLSESGSFTDAVGTMAKSTFTDQGLPDDVLQCPQCGAACEDGQIRMHHAFVSYDYPTEGPLLICRDCRTEYCVRPAVIDND